MSLNVKVFGFIVTFKIMKINSHFILVFAFCIIGSLCFVSSCQKEQALINKENTVQNTSNLITESRTDICVCPSGGCNGPATLRMEVLDRVHEPVANVYLFWKCGASNNQSLCYYWPNPQIGDFVDIPIGYASNTGGQIPVGIFSPHYVVETLFYVPITSNSKLTVKFTGPGINQIVTFNTSLAPPPIIYSTQLYPWQWCI